MSSNDAKTVPAPALITRLASNSSNASERPQAAEHSAVPLSPKPFVQKDEPSDADLARATYNAVSKLTTEVVHLRAEQTRQGGVQEVQGQQIAGLKAEAREARERIDALEAHGVPLSALHAPGVTLQVRPQAKSVTSEVKDSIRAIEHTSQVGSEKAVTIDAKQDVQIRKLDKIESRQVNNSVLTVAAILGVFCASYANNCHLPPADPHVASPPPYVAPAAPPALPALPSSR